MAVLHRVKAEEAVAAAEAATPTPINNDHDIDPCKILGRRHPGCNNKVGKPSNPYSRGCEIIFRCRQGGDTPPSH
ncbi:hypothetical protein O6P43_026711 [Quillaja saponaria]|uniref:Rapid ALkalinization Factor n=1 Tax=Quillaja saponaria TaxID=32244 RepID=A0AAD7L2U6_QUISA|nr:hypothetical protein O6P43_026711 [Quillaja saponaria]